MNWNEFVKLVNRKDVLIIHFDEFDEMKDLLMINFDEFNELKDEFDFVSILIFLGLFFSFEKALLHPSVSHSTLGLTE